MRSAAEAVKAVPEHQIYSAAVVCKERELEEVCTCLGPLLEPRTSFARPDFFLASISRGVWKPRIVAVKQRGELVGALYAKERRVAGISTGIIYGDATLAGMVTAKASFRGAVFYAAVDALLRRRTTLGLRLLLPPDSYEVQMLESLVRQHNVDYTTAPAENHVLLPLGHTYDEFLGRLGPRTRRNFRYYRRKFELDGSAYVEDVPMAEFRMAAETLLRQKVVGADREGVARAFAMFAQARKPILTGLRDKNGNWLS